MIDKTKYISRKFILSCAVLTVASVALFLRVFDGGSYVALSTLVLGLYGASNIAETKVLKASDLASKPSQKAGTQDPT